MVKDSNTEKRIIEAARRVFLKKGMAGARMQEIADEAGINKALVHYYFRNKEKLFDYIFTEVIEKISSGLEDIFEKDMGVIDRSLSLVDAYITVLLENRYLPLFVLNEINHNPEKFASLLKENVAAKMGQFIIQIQDEVDKGLIRPIHPIHLLMNVLGLVIFPFAAYPLVSKVAGKEMEPLIQNFLEERKTVVQEFIVNALTPQK